ncbi:MAG: glyoxylate/hydroxypyruvate reductase A, partial [Balneolaceae bacterium]
MLLSTKHDLQPYKQALLNLDPNLDVEVWPEVKNKKRITFAAAWGQPKDVFRYYPNLKVISSFGAGVEHLVYDETLPEYITITRLVSPSLRHQMADYIETVCYNFIRKMPSYWQQKKKGIWKPLRHLHKKDLAVGIMGLG